jgi:hypothetical protein
VDIEVSRDLLVGPPRVQVQQDADLSGREAGKRHAASPYLRSQ